MKLTTIKSLVAAALAAFALCLGARAANEDKTWMVVDLRTGALSYYGYDLATATNTFNTPLYKTEKMVFRRIPAGLYCKSKKDYKAYLNYKYHLVVEWDKVQGKWAWFVADAKQGKFRKVR